MFLSVKMLNNFPIFTHARITKFNIKAFGEDRAYLLFLDQMAVFSGRNSEFFPFQLEWTTSQDVGRYKDIRLAQITSELTSAVLEQVAKNRAPGFKEEPEK